MKNSEIRARIDDYQHQIKEYGYLVVYDSIWMTNIIETLLARQADAIRDLKNRHTLSRDDNVNVALWNALDAMRAILDPPLAEEKKNGE